MSSVETAVSQCWFAFDVRDTSFLSRLRRGSKVVIFGANRDQNLHLYEHSRSLFGTVILSLRTNAGFDQDLLQK